MLSILDRFKKPWIGESTSTLKSRRAFPWLFSTVMHREIFFQGETDLTHLYRGPSYFSLTPTTGRCNANKHHHEARIELPRLLPTSTGSHVSVRPLVYVSIAIDSHVELGCGLFGEKTQHSPGDRRPFHQRVSWDGGAADVDIFNPLAP